MLAVITVRPGVVLGCLGSDFFPERVENGLIVLRDVARWLGSQAKVAKGMFKTEGHTADVALQGNFPKSQQHSP